MRNFKVLFCFLVLFTFAQANDTEEQELANKKQAIMAELQEINQALQRINEVLPLVPDGAEEVVISQEILKYFPIAYIATFMKKYPRARIVGVLLPFGYVIKITYNKAVCHLLVFIKEALEDKKHQLEWSLKTLPKNLK